MDTVLPTPIFLTGSVHGMVLSLTGIVLSRTVLFTATIDADCGGFQGVVRAIDTMSCALYPT